MTRYFLIGTKYGRSEDVLPQMQRLGVISTGFSANVEIGDLFGEPCDVVRQKLKERLSDPLPEAFRTLSLLTEMRPGDIVALKAHSAPRGRQARLVIARYAVVAGNGMPRYARHSGLGHCLSVEFLDEQHPVEFPLGYGRTLHEIKGERISVLFGAYSPLDNGVEECSGQHALTDRPVHESVVPARASYVMERAHNQIQNQMREALVRMHGEPAIRQEEDWIDLQLCLSERIVLFEVKSSPSPLACTREALGQLLHYGWRVQSNSPLPVEYVVVGSTEADERTERFLSHLRATTSLRIRYCTPSTYSAN